MPNFPHCWVGLCLGVVCGEGSNRPRITTVLMMYWDIGGVILARVLGNVVSTVKHPSLNGRAVFAVQPLDADEKPSGDSFLAVDNAQAGPGDTVIILREGNGIRSILGDAKSPIRCLIVGIVDQIAHTTEAR